MQTQRMILWIVFSISLLFLWDAWQRSQGQASLFGGSPPATQTAGVAPAGGAAPTPPAKSDASIPAGPTTAAGGAGAVPSADAAGKGAGAVADGAVYRLSNDVLVLDVDSLGGQVRRGELLAHRDADARDRNVLLLQNDPGKVFLAQSGFIGGAQGAPFPTHRTRFAAEGVTGSEVRLADGAEAVRLVMSAEAGGLKVTRTYTLKRGAYVVEVTDALENQGAAPVRPTLYLQLARDTHKPPGESQFYSTYTGPVIYTEATKFQKVDFNTIEKGKTDHAKGAADGWLGIIQHYFVTAWIPTEKANREYFTRKIDTNFYAVGALQPLDELAPGAKASVTSRLLVGPQDQKMLETVAPGLELTVDYGFLTAIAKPIFWLLDVCYQWAGNWGWAIVLLTIIIKTAFYPLQAASYRSMARMKAVTPKLMAIREKYGNDRVKMNQAMMELYKTEKINPLGGCLPIVVQIPVFIALYWVLLASVEMRNAPWIGWIHDLATPDPWYILPLIMAGTMFIQVKLNPTPPDPIQARMMTIMPIVFSVMFFFFPAGLVLYWLVNNVYSIAQQWFITRQIEKAAAAKKA